MKGFDSLFDEDAKYESKLDSLRDLWERVCGYYFTQRSPIIEYIEIACEDIQNDKIEVQNLIQALTEKVK